MNARHPANDFPKPSPVPDASPGGLRSASDPDSPEGGLAGPDTRVLRRALGNFATGVTVATARDGDSLVGVTANSFSSVSLDPPLVLWCIDKRSRSFPVFQRATHFAINVLADHQIALSNQFASARTQRFSGVPCRAGLGGCILLEETSAGFECEKVQILEGGDHWILLGRVVSFEDHGRAPLLYHQGSYSLVLPHPERQQPAAGGGAPPSPRRRLEDHPYYLMAQAVRSYQQAYQPEQIRTGWRPGEARILMILEAGPSSDVPLLAREADMPQHEVEQTLDLLRSRAMVQRTGGAFGLTDAGMAQARAIWDLAQRQEDHIFAGFDAAQVRIFKKILKGIIATTGASIV